MGGMSPYFRRSDYSVSNVFYSQSTKTVNNDNSYSTLFKDKCFKNSYNLWTYKTRREYGGRIARKIPAMEMNNIRPMTWMFDKKCFCIVWRGEKYPKGGVGLQPREQICVFLDIDRLRHTWPWTHLHLKFNNVDTVLVRYSQAMWRFSITWNIFC